VVATGDLRANLAPFGCCGTGAGEKNGPLRSILVPYGYTGERFCPVHFQGGPQWYFLIKKTYMTPSGTLCARITPMQAVHSAHTAHTRYIRQKQQTRISRNILNTATLKSAATAARQRMHTRRRVTRRPWALPPPPPPSPPPLPPPPGSTREPRDRSTGHRASHQIRYRGEALYQKCLQNGLSLHRNAGGAGQWKERCG